MPYIQLFIILYYKGEHFCGSVPVRPWISPKTNQIDAPFLATMPEFTWL